MTATIRSFAFVAALAVLSFLQACGGGGGGDTAPPVATDTTPPSVLSATPANGATGVPANAFISLTVSEPLRCGPTVTGNFGTITGTLTCTNTADRALVVVVPSAPLTPLARYTFRFSGYQDPAGNTGPEFVSEFTVVAAADTRPPTLQSVSLADGATGVSVTLPNTVYTFDEDITCRGQVTITAPDHAAYTIVGTTTCAGKTLTFTPDPTAPKAYYGTVHTRTLPVGAVSDASGNLLAVANVGTFTTARPAVANPKLYVSLFPEADGSKAVAIVDAAAGTVKQVGFPGVPGFSMFSATVVDSMTGKVYFASKGGFKVYVRDLATDDIRPSIDLDPTLTTTHAIWAMTRTENAVCIAMSASLPLGVSQNRLRCFDPRSHAVTFDGANNSLATASMFMTGLQYVTAPAKRLYAIAALTTAMEEFFPPAGTPGTLVKLHPTSYAVEQTYAVGSVPTAFRVHDVTGQVWVANAGDKTISIVNPTSGQVETMGLGFTRTQQRPEGLLLDLARNRVFVTDGESKVYVYDLSTRREVAQFTLGVGTTVPKQLAILGNELWVTCANGTVVAINLDTLAITRTLIVGNSPVGLTSYAPSSSQ